MLKSTHISTFLIFGLLFVCVSTSTTWLPYPAASQGEIFRFDKIKLDRSFVAGIEHDGHSAAIVRTVLQLGRALGIDTLAEGVETERQATLLAAEGCDQLQGFYFSPAVPVDRISELLALSASMAARDVTAEQPSDAPSA